MLTNNRSMKRAIAALCVATLACSAVGCGEEKKEAIPTFSNATYIAQLRKVLFGAVAAVVIVIEQYVRNVLGDDAKNWTIEFKDVQ